MARIFLLLSTVGHYSLFPLLFQPAGKFAFLSVSITVTVLYCPGLFACRGMGCYVSFPLGVTISNVMIDS